MKKLFTSIKHKRINKTRASNRLKRGLNYKECRKKKYVAYQGKTKEQKKEIRNIENTKKTYTIVIAPKKFSFIKYPEKATEFINKLERLYLKHIPAYVDLLNVECLDHSAIAVLASIARTFKTKKVKFNGKFPKNQELAKLFIDSDFFKYLTNQPIGKIEYTIGKNNQMFTTKNAEVNPELGSVIMQEASKTILGEKRTYKGLQRTLLELMQNANNHAKLKDKCLDNWWLSVNHDKDKETVSFIFVDYGIGIFKSLGSKSSGKWQNWQEKAADTLKGNKKILEELMNGKLHKTVTGKDFRGKGLPGIKEVLNRNQISNLHIVSNDVFANVSENKYNKLPEGFNGTFVYWELNNKNESLEWIE